MSPKTKATLLLTITLILLLSSGAFALRALRPNVPPTFDGQRALADAAAQLNFGPRIPGQEGHRQFRQWLQEELQNAGWEVDVQQTEALDQPIYNLIAHRAGEANPAEGWVILGAHYDTRIYADQDPDPARRMDPVPGANDGASGVAVLLELARALPDDLPYPVWLVFFDAEDNGRIPGWDWILGSRAFVAQLEGEPAAVVIVDMIGDRELNIPIEKNSSTRLIAEIWAQAATLGYSDRFLATPGYRMLDDHTPFLEAGIPAVDIIDFDYPYWHTTADTLDKLSAESLQAVGDTLLAWLLSRQP